MSTENKVVLPVDDQTDIPASLGTDIVPEEGVPTKVPKRTVKPRTKKVSESDNAAAIIEVGATEVGAQQEDSSKPGAKPIERKVSLDQAIQETGSRREALAQARARARKNSEYQAEKEEHFMRLAKLREAHNQGAIVTGTINSVEEAMGEIFAITTFEGVKVMIPFSEMYCDADLTVGPHDTEASIVRRKKQIITKGLQARIRYVIKAVHMGDTDNTDIIVQGSRKEAMLRDQKRYYTAAAGRTPFVQPNKVYDADVIAVGTHGIRACVCGVDTQIWTYGLTYRCVDDLSQLYYPGQTIKVKIHEISPTREGGVGFSIICSGKAPELEEYQKNIGKVMQGALYIARVVKMTIRSNSLPVAHVFLNDMDVPGTAKLIKSDGMSRPLRQGDVVVFRVDAVHEYGMAEGAIVRLLYDRESFLKMNKK